MRLTRRGRLVCYALVVAVLAAVVAVLLALDPGVGVASSDERVSSTEVVIRPGDTLWAVAVRHDPEQDPVVTIEEIRRLNGLSSYTVHPGQTLRLP